MNALPVFIYTISSLEVAEMIGMEHKELLRRIKRFTKQFNEGNNALVDMGQSKIAPSEFWIESTYTNSQNKQQPCYQITKKGCEFIAHKTTGTKGTIFTARYINRFHEMEEALKKDEPQFLPVQTEEPKFLPISDFEIANYIRTELTDPPLPPLVERTWRTEHYPDIQYVMFKLKLSEKQLYHKILTYLGKKYDIPDCRRIYKQCKGRMPKYYMDVIDLFPEMANDATEYLEHLKNTMFI